MNIVGVWDGHDSGAALIIDGTLVAAINEERLTRRKLEVCFPDQSIAACCELGGIAPEAVDIVAGCTFDPAKTLVRLVPSTKEAYYQIRRRKAPPGTFARLRKRLKYYVTEWQPNPASRAISLAALRRAVRRSGLNRAEVRIYDHHASHAVAAAHASGYDGCTVITIDGVGDGTSATVSTFVDGRLRLVSRTPARHSIGIFFEHVTNLLNMRELEDEGKVMALADYAAAIPDAANPLLEMVRVEGLRFTADVPGHALYQKLRNVLWYYPNEQFAAMAQRALERACVQLARNAVAATGLPKVALAGGVASNVKANRLIRLLPEVDDVFVFPHMGDGGLAVGAALLASVESGITPRLRMDDLGWGPTFSDEAIRTVLDRRAAPYVRCDDIASATADLLAAGQVVLWFQGGMEYGPRALGHRSVLARPDRPALRDRLNLILKRRVWYQPFCPSLLEGDARVALSDWKGSPNRYMTMAYMVAEGYRSALSGVINIDGSCRPQMVPDDANDLYAALLREVKARTGFGALLNTSFNIHGEPLVCTPDQALDVFMEGGADALALGSFLMLRPSPAI